MRLGREYRLGNRYQDKSWQRRPFHLESLRLFLGPLGYAAPSDVCRLIIQQGSDQAKQFLVLRTAPGTQEGSDLDVINTAASG